MTPSGNSKLCYTNPMPRRNLHKHMHKHVDKKLRNRLRMYLFISIALFGIVTYETISNAIGFQLALISLGIGIIIGAITARRYRISWNHDAKKIVSQLDIFGIIILVLYLLFSIFRGRIIGHFIYGSAVGSVSISITTGAMIGRFLGTRGGIIQVLKEQNIF